MKASSFFVRHHVLLRGLASTLLVLLYFCWWRDAAFFGIDSPTYIRYANDIYNGHWLSPQSRTIGYPLLLAFSYLWPASYRVLFLIQLPLHFSAVNLLCSLLKKYGFGLKWIWAFFLIAALPSFVETSANMMTENMTAFLLVAGVFMLFVFRRPTFIQAVAASLLFCWATLCRPTYQLFVIPALIPLLYGLLRPVSFAGRIIYIAGFLLPFVIILGAFSSYNQRHFGFSGLTPTLPYNLCTRTSHLLNDIPEGKYSALKKKLILEHQKGLLLDLPHSGEMYIWSLQDSDFIRLTGKGGVAFGPEMMALNLNLIRHKPLNYLYEVAKSVPGYFFPEFPPGSVDSAALQLFSLLLHACFITLFFLSCVYFLYRFLRRILREGGAGLLLKSPAEAFILMLFILIIYTAVISCSLDVGLPRYRQPTDLFMLCLIFFCLKGLKIKPIFLSLKELKR
jgi:hypothetical protein